MSTLGGVAQIWSLTVVTMERAWVVTCITTDRVHKVSKSTTKLVVMCIWLGSMLLSAPPLFGINRFVYEVHTMSSIYISTTRRVQGYLYSSSIDYLTRDDPASTAYCWLLLLLAWGLPNILILASHILIIAVYRPETRLL